MSDPETFPRELRNVDARAWHGDIPVQHTYTVGVAGEEFFSRLRDSGALTASVHESGRTWMPPRTFCPETFAPVEGWVEVGPEGTVDTFTSVARRRGGEAFEEPRVLALIRFEGVEGGLLHWVGGCAPDEVHIGMRVKAVVRPKKERSGSLEDIRHFAPA